MIPIRTDLLAMTQHIHKSKPRHLVTVSDAMAVMQKESGQVSYFNNSDHLYHDNLAAASHITGLAQAEIITSVTSLAVAKFRCEPGYWEWSSHLGGEIAKSKINQFLLSCSFGLGQKMMRWFVDGVPEDKWIESIHKFMREEEMQVLYVLGDMDKLLVQSQGNRSLAYTRYNGGAGKTAVTLYGKVVNSFYQDISVQLNGPS